MRCENDEKLKRKGPCGSKTFCFCVFKSTKYVCGVDGKTYKNKCELECARMKLDYNGKCDAR